MIYMDVLLYAHVLHCILFCICIFYHVLCHKWHYKSVKSMYVCSWRWHFMIALSAQIDFWVEQLPMKQTSQEVTFSKLCFNQAALIYPIRARNIWVYTQHYGYWCRGTKAPGHQHLQCWLNIQCIWSMSWRDYYIYWEKYKKAKF